jgi:hypothetical protein
LGACKQRSTASGALGADDANGTDDANVTVDQNVLLQYDNPTGDFVSLAPKQHADTIFLVGDVVNQRDLEDCWFLSSKIAYEFDLEVLGHGTPISLDHLYTELYRSWLGDYVQGNDPTGMDTGGDEFVFDAFMAKHGFMPMNALDHGHNNQQWLAFDKKIQKEADSLKDQYANADDAKKAKVLAKASTWLEDFFTKNQIGPIPDTFDFESQKGISPVDFLTYTGIDQGTTNSYVNRQDLADTYTKAAPDGHVYEFKSRADIEAMIKASIDSGHALRTALNWSWSRIDETSANVPGVVNVKHGTGTHESVPHEVLTVGYRMDGDKMIAVKIQNSWGKDSGDQGYYYFDMAGFWDFFRAISVRSYPSRN